jgi:uncharacterized membrane protein YkvA (DUF1232 family)
MGSDRQAGCARRLSGIPRSRVPRHAKALAMAVAAYALSPIDLIPDFILVIGYLDDLIIVPLGIIAVVRMIPPEVMAEHRAATALAATRPASKAGLVVIVSIWILLAAFAGWLVSHSAFGNSN